MVQCEEMDPVVEKPLSFGSSSCMQGHHKKNTKWRNIYQDFLMIDKSWDSIILLLRAPLLDSPIFSIKTSIKNNKFSCFLEKISKQHLKLPFHPLIFFKATRKTSSGKQPKQTQQNTMRFFSDQKTHHRFLGIHSRGLMVFCPDLFQQMAFCLSTGFRTGPDENTRSIPRFITGQKNTPKRTLAKVTPLKFTGV